MKKNGGETYLNKLVGSPLNDGANIINNFYNWSGPTLANPKCDTHLVPYEEMPLQIFYPDVYMCQVRQVDNNGTIEFIYLIDRAQCANEGPSQNLDPVPMHHNLLDSLRNALSTAHQMRSSASNVLSTCTKEDWNKCSSASEDLGLIFRVCVNGASKNSSPLGWNIRDWMRWILFFCRRETLPQIQGQEVPVLVSCLFFSSCFWSQ